jgi:hypothetical protein
MATPTETIAAALVGKILDTVAGVEVPAGDKLAIIAIKNYTDIPRYPPEKVCVEIFSGKEYGITLAEDITTEDAVAPTVSTLVPADDATDIAIDADLVVTFSETILAGAGNVVLHKASDDSVVETFKVDTSDLVTIDDDEVTIVLTEALLNNTGYYVKIDADAFTGDIGNTFAGIDDKTTWSFTTVAA